MAELKKHQLIPSISSTIKQSKQYSQLHAVILAKQELFYGRELAELASSIGTPVIAILKPPSNVQSQVKPWPNTRRYELRVGDKNVSVLAVGVGKEEAERIFAIACHPSAIVPEAVRVAELIVKQA